MTDPRGGLFLDSGDGRGPIHTDDLSDAERASFGLPPRPTTTVVAAPAEAPPTDVTEDSTDGR